MKMNRKITSIGILLVAFCVLLGAAGLSTAQTPGAQTLPDIQITDMDFSIDEPIKGNEMTITATVLNNGSIPLANITVAFLVDGAEIGNVTGITLAVNGTQTVSHVWIVEDGTHTISAMVEIKGMPLMDSTLSETLAVPVGDFTTLLLALAAIALTVLIVALVPSILGKLIK